MHFYRLHIIAVFISLLCLATAMEGKVTAARSDAGLIRLEKKIHALLNRERAKHGLAALSLDADLQGIARKHSQDMARRNYFSHDDPEGRSFSDRYRAAGFECRVRTGSALCTGAENISQFYSDASLLHEGGKTVLNSSAEDAIAESVVRGWMNSRNHRENILTPYFRRQGIGVALSDDGKIYVTENFC